MYTLAIMFVHQRFQDSRKRPKPIAAGGFAAGQLVWARQQRGPFRGREEEYTLHCHEKKEQISAKVPLTLDTQLNTK
jgi:hypothetical protein